MERGPNVVLYDLEIKNDIDKVTISWEDHHKMGISVCCLFDYEDGLYKFYDERNLDQLVLRLNTASLRISFNGENFDDKVIAKTSGKEIRTDNHYDILQQIWNAAKLPKTFNARTHGGCGLDATCQATLGIGKVGIGGAEAPRAFREGRIAEVYSYCLVDVNRTKALAEHIREKGFVITPKHGKLEMASLELVEEA